MKPVSISWAGIVKVQRGLNAGSQNRILVYDKPRSICEEFDLSPQSVKSFFGEDELKVYCVAVVQTDGTLRLIERIALDW